MAKFKILGGQFSEKSRLLVGEKIWSKLDGGVAVTSLAVTSLTGFLGVYMLETRYGSTSPILPYIDEITEITEDNAVNFKGAAGWGIVGGLLTGGVGLLAGAILGGRGKTKTFAVRFKGGSQFLCRGKSKDYAKLLGAAGKF